MELASILTLIVAGIVALLTFIVSLRALKACSVLNNPIISLCVGGLTFIGLTSLPSGWLYGLLIPYVALGLTLVLLLLIRPFLKGKEDCRKKFLYLERSDEEKKNSWEKEMRLRGRNRKTVL